jgi:hypothetical protein
MAWRTSTTPTLPEAAEPGAVPCAWMAAVPSSERASSAAVVRNANLRFTLFSLSLGQTGVRPDLRHFYIQFGKKFRLRQAETVAAHQAQQGAFANLIL